ncbi:MAG: hypothetical protein VX777_06390 [Chlamydiota bacterium]|nr:hypothetical protein [Chlamydiota bacterium]
MSVTIANSTQLLPAVHACAKGSQYVIDGANALKNNTGGFCNVLRVSNYVLMGLEFAVGAVKPITLSIMKVTGCITVIDFFSDLIELVHYWVCAEILDDVKEGKVCNILGMITLGFATIGGSLAWLSELGFFNLGAIAASMGSIPIFGAAVGAIATVGLAPVLCGVVALAYAFFAGDAVQSIIKATNKEQRIKASIDLVSRVADVALAILVGVTLLCPVSPAVTIPLIVTLGLVAKGLAVVSFLYKHYNKKAFES